MALFLQLLFHSSYVKVFVPLSKLYRPWGLPPLMPAYAFCTISIIDMPYINGQHIIHGGPDFRAPGGT